MASGDDIEAGRTTHASDRTILIGQKSRPTSDFVGDFIFEAVPAAGGQRLAPDRDLIGLRGIGNRGGQGVVGIGGFMDRADRTFGSTGVFGIAGDVAVTRTGGSGVIGLGGRGSRNVGGIGVFGVGGAGDNAADGPGVFGQSNTAQGVVGVSGSNSTAGVHGFNPSTAGGAFGVFGQCDSPGGGGVTGTNAAGEGVQGFSGNDIGVAGRSGGFIGVYGLAQNIGVEGEGRGVGVLGYSPTGHGVIGIAHTPGKFAGSFSGNVQVVGAITVFGAKSAAVRTGKNSYRRLYSMESPESWFEDFGEAALRSGRATVRIPADFAPLVRTGDYHVFITPNGDCSGLFVANRTRTQFEVRELGGGRSNVRFSYRIVARRKDIAGKRLEKVTPPEVSEPAKRARKLPAVKGDTRRMLPNREVAEMRRTATRGHGRQRQQA